MSPLISKFSTFFFTLLAHVTFSAAWAAEAAAGAEPPAIKAVGSLDVSTRTDKLVIAVGQGKSNVLVYAFEKIDGKWTERMKIDGFAGYNGIWKTTTEGAKRTPSGMYTLGRTFGVADDPGSRKPYTKLTSNDFWVDDPGSKYYNQWVSGDVPDKDWNSAENLFEQKIAYKYAIVINYNMDLIVKGAGSAIFLHCSKGGPTAGCVAVPESSMIDLLRFIDERTLIVIAASPSELETF
jgi:L,D-peptidoglycan transpeptidase YkuD (ErfK/YbiS/YcfS/YnhG family)